MAETKKNAIIDEKVQSVSILRQKTHENQVIIKLDTFSIKRYNYHNLEYLRCLLEEDPQSLIQKPEPY